MTIISVTRVRHDWPLIEAGVSRGETLLVKKRKQNLAVITPWQDKPANRKSTSANLLKGTAAISPKDLLSPETEDWRDA
jgi:hypothetical protein